jgi:hypothetical protein
MATRFLENFNETSVQTGEEIQEKSKAKVGKTEMDEGCEDCAAGVHCLWVVLAVGLGIG